MAASPAKRVTNCIEGPMTIRRRLTLSYAVLLLLGAANLTLYLATSQLRTRSMHTLDRALHRQLLLSSIRGEVDDLHKQVTLLSQMDFESGEGGGMAQGRQLFGQKLRVVTDLLAQLAALAEPADASSIAAVQKQYAEVSAAWGQFYDYLGVEQTWSVASAARAEPLSLRLQRSMLPALQQSEQVHVRLAQDEFARVERLSDRLSIAFFVISAVLSIGVAWLVSRHLARGFQTL